MFTTAKAQKGDGYDSSSFTPSLGLCTIGDNLTGFLNQRCKKLFKGWCGLGYFPKLKNFDLI